MAVRSRANGPMSTLLSHDAPVPFYDAEEPEVRLRWVAHRAGITERAVRRIAADLDRIEPDRCEALVRPTVDDSKSSVTGQVPRG